MHVDVMLTPQPLARMDGTARAIEAAGIDGILFTEAGRTPYLSAAVAAVAAPSLALSTGVAVAFPRSPMITAQVAWELQEATGGKFRLGLGTQVLVDISRPGSRSSRRPICPWRQFPWSRYSLYRPQGGPDMITSNVGKVLLNRSQPIM